MRKHEMCRVQERRLYAWWHVFTSEHVVVDNGLLGEYWLVMPMQQMIAPAREGGREYILCPVHLCFGS